MLGAAAAVALSARAEGAYDVRVWAPLGLAVAAALAFLAAYGLAMSRAVAVTASALVALGLWAVASTAWGGLPQVAWLTLDRSLIAAGALVLGSTLAASGRAGLVAAGVLGGIAVQCAEILVRTATASAPAPWFRGRVLDGPVGYHNAQGLLCALGVPLALWAASGSRAWTRAAGGAATASLLAVLLLTQSRGALAAVAVAAVCVVALTQRRRTFAVACALAACAAALAVALRAVDEALLTGGAADALRTYALVAGACAGAIAVVAAMPGPAWASRLGRRSVAACGAAAVALAAASTPAVWPSLRAAAERLPTDAAPSAAPGETRFATISLDGRGDAWRVATNAIRAHPLTGDGVGRFAVRWGVERRSQLYIIQPHSIELELGAELGAPGIALFAVFLSGAALVLRRGLRADRSLAAAASGVVAGFVVAASADWTWSFPGLVAPALLVVGASAAPVAARPRRLLAPLAVAAILVLALPWAADRRLSQPSSTAAVQAALRLDPWNPDAVSAQGRLLESHGDLAGAADRYARAAQLSQRPWLEWYRAARVLRRAGATVAAVEACLLAQHADPAEDLLHAGPCGWPWLSLHAPGTRPPGPEGPTRRFGPAT